MARLWTPSALCQRQGVVGVDRVRNASKPRTARPRDPTARRFPSPRFGDYSRTRFESRVAFGGPDEDAEGELSLATPTRQFSLLEITSGLPDDCREADERAAERRLRDLRGRVKAARAGISGTPGAEEILRRDWVKAAHFYAAFGITEREFRSGVPPEEGMNMKVTELHKSYGDWTVEARARRSASLHDSGSSVYAPASSR